jgi:hypothetical protein
VLLIREMMVQNGDAHKPIWASEVGWNALPREFDGFPYFGRVSEDLQAEYSAQAYQRAQLEWPWMGVMSYWFFKRASDHEKDQAFYYFRMMEPDFYAYPVYGAMKEQATSVPILGLGYHQQDHWALRYEGGWQDVADERAVLGSYRASEQPGDSVSFTFWGTDLDLVLVCGSDSGRLEMTLDGRHRELDLCNSGSEYQIEAPVARGLVDGQHQVQFMVAEGARGGSRAAIDGIIVRHSLTYLIRRLALLVGATVGVGLLYAWRRRRLSRGSPR